MKENEMEIPEKLVEEQPENGSGDARFVRVWSPYDTCGGHAVWPKQEKTICGRDCALWFYEWEYTLFDFESIGCKICRKTLQLLASLEEEK